MREKLLHGNGCGMSHHAVASRRKCSSPLTQENMALLFNYQSIDEVHEEQESFHKSPQIKGEALSSSSPFVTTHPGTPVKEADSPHEVHENQKFSESLRVRREAPSFFSAPSATVKTDCTSAASPVIQSDSQLDICENFYESPGLRMEAPRSPSVSLTSSEAEFSSSSSWKKSGSQLQAHNKNFYEAPEIRVHAPSFSSASFASAETDINSEKKSDSSYLSSQDSEGKGGRVHVIKSLRRKSEDRSAGEKWESGESRASSSYLLNVDLPDGIK